MVARVRLGEGPEKGVEKRLQRVERAAPLGYSSITRGGMRIASAEGLTIQGTSRTTGTQNIDGTLNGSGTIDWTGPSWMRGTTVIQGSASISGPLTVSNSATFSGNTNIGGTCTIGASLTVNGPWDMNGDGDIAGSTTVTGDMTVTGGGKITVNGGGGAVVLDSSFGAPRIQLGNAQIDGGNSSFTFTVGSQVVYFLNNTIRIPGMPTRPVADYPGGFAGAIVSDLSGNFYRLA